MRSRFPLLLLTALLLLLGACSKPDPTVILGSWRAESFALDSLKLPIAPNIEVTRNEVILKTPGGEPFQRFPLSAIRADGKTIELEFKDGLGVSLVFVVEARNRVLFQVPFIGFNVAYNKVE